MYSAVQCEHAPLIAIDEMDGWMVWFFIGVRLVTAHALLPDSSYIHEVGVIRNMAVQL